MKKSPRIHTHSILKDLRLESRFESLLGALSSNLNATVPQSTGTRASSKAAYRFWDNEQLTPEMLLAYHMSKVSNMHFGKAGKKRFLQLSDSTELDYTKHRCAPALGPLNYQRQRGLLLHNSLLINDVGCPLGLLKQSFIIRTPESFGQSVERCKSALLSDKETWRWCEHFEAGQSLCQQDPDLEIVFVADREADFMELLVRRTEPNMHFIVRSQHDRKLSSGVSKLSAALAAQAPQGCYTLQVMDPKTRKMRRACLQVRACPVTLKLHKAAPQRKNLPPLHVFALDVQEITAGIDAQEAIHWRLLTSLPADSLEDILQIVQYYVWRWLIERFHFLLKSGGAEVEKLQLATRKRLLNAISTYSIAAMDAFKLKYLAEKQPDTPIYEVGISPLQHQVLYTYAQQKVDPKIQFKPDEPPTVREYCILLGRIAGFFPSKRQPIPGLIILSRALEKFNFLVDAYLIFCQRTE